MDAITPEDNARLGFEALRYGLADALLTRALIRTLHRRGILTEAQIQDVFADALRETEDHGESALSPAETIRRMSEDILSG